MTGAVSSGLDEVAESFAGYSGDPPPYAGYTTLTATFFAAVAAAAVAARARGHELPERVGAGDIATIGIATHKLSRVISKDRVTSFLRAPFVRYVEPKGHGELSEEPRGEGLRLAIGQLLVCPHCLDQWVAAGFGVGLVAAPRWTRLTAAVYTAQAVADFLHLAYLAAEEETR